MSVTVKNTIDLLKVGVKTVSRLFLISLVCASCVMFGDHKKHKILSLSDATSFLRELINVRQKTGLLRKEHHEVSQLKVREVLLTLEKEKNFIIKRIDTDFKKLSYALKERKNELLDDIAGKFEQEKQKVEVEENKWLLFK